jgi:hypothetical protein
MTRSEFCCAGLCTISGLTALAAAPQSQTPPPAEALGELTWKLDAAQTRMAKLLGILNETLDESSRKRLLNRLGQECAANYRTMADKYRGNVRGFLAEAQKSWMASAEYDERAGTIRIVDKSGHCTCPLVKEGVTPKEFCNCTLGWQESMYSQMLGRRVQAELEESILRGDKRCVFRIRVI